MRSEHNIIFILWLTGMFWFTFLASTQAQQLRTDELFMQKRDSVKLRLRLKQAKALRHQTANPEKVQAFLSKQASKGDRLQFDAAKQFLSSRKALIKSRENWETYLVEKMQEEARIQQSRDHRVQTPQAAGLAEVRNNFLAKEERKQLLLRKKPIERQASGALRLQQQEDRFKEFVARKNRHLQRLPRGASAEDIQRQRFAKKSGDYEQFIQTRDQNRNNLRSGKGGRRLRRNLNQKQDDYRSFTKKKQQSREESNLVDLTPEELLQRKFSEKRQEFQEFVTTFEKTNAEQRQINLSPDAARHAINRSKKDDYQGFVSQRKQTRENAPILDLTLEDLQQQRFNENADKYQAFAEEKKRHDSLRVGIGLDVDEFRKQQFQKNRDRYASFVEDRRDRQITAIGRFGITIEEARQRAFQSKAPAYQQYVDEKNAHAALKVGGGLERADFLTEEFRKKSSKFDEFLARQKEKHGLAPAESGFNAPPPGKDPLQEERTTAQSEAVQKLVQRDIPPEFQRFETQALKFNDFLNRARSNRDRSIERARLQQELNQR